MGLTMAAKTWVAKVVAVSLLMTLAGVSDLWAWGSGGGGAPPPDSTSQSTAAPGAAAPTWATQNAQPIMSLLEEARRRAAQVRAETEALRANVARRAAVIQKTPTNAAYNGLQSAVASSAPAIEGNLTALIRIGNTLTADVSR